MGDERAGHRDQPRPGACPPEELVSLSQAEVRRGVLRGHDDPTIPERVVFDGECRTGVYTAKSLRSASPTSSAIARSSDWVVVSDKSLRARRRAHHDTIEEKEMEADIDPKTAAEIAELETRLAILKDKAIEKGK